MDPPIRSKFSQQEPEKKPGVSNSYKGNLQNGGPFVNSVGPMILIFWMGSPKVRMEFFGEEKFFQWPCNGMITYRGPYDDG